jgi:drug/metabolite transporter (DMT)-like permease
VDWRILALTVPTLFVVYQSLSKLLPKGTSVFLVNAYASLIGLIIMLGLHLLTQPNKSLSLPSRTLWIALGIGTLIGLGNFGIIKAYSLGAPQSQFTPLFYITLIIYGIILGFVLWHEKLNSAQLVGLLLALSGLIVFFRFKK